MNEIQPIIKGVIASIPYAGGGVITWWNEREFIKYKKNLESFTNWTKEEIERLIQISEKNIDKDYLETEEFENLFLRLIKDFIETNTIEKRNAYKNILLNSITIERPSIIVREQYLHIMEQSSSTEIKILATIYTKQQSLSPEALQNLDKRGLPRASKVTIKEISESLNIHSDEALNIIWTIVSKGLLYPLNNELSSNSFCTITPFGANFCKYILSDS